MTTPTPAEIMAANKEQLNVMWAVANGWTSVETRNFWPNYDATIGRPPGSKGGLIKIPAVTTDPVAFHEAMKVVAGWDGDRRVSFCAELQKLLGDSYTTRVHVMMEWLESVYDGLDMEIFIRAALLAMCENNQESHG